MSTLKGRILFITEDLFIPAQNGSARIYYHTADEYKRQGNEIFCIAAYRRVEETQLPFIKEQYRVLFRDVLFIPGINFRGTALAKLGLVLREAKRTLSGNVYSRTPFYGFALRPFITQIKDFISSNRIDVIYFHKPHTIQMMYPLLRELEKLKVVVEMHDDFIERADQYRRAYHSFFSKLHLKTIATEYGSEFVKLLRMARLNVSRSRLSEANLLYVAGGIFLASEDEFVRYRENTSINHKLIFRPWQFDERPVDRRTHTDARYDAGFFSADDIMNLDGLVHFCSDILPIIRKKRPGFSFLVAGLISDKARSLVGNLPGVTIYGPVEQTQDFYDAVSIVVIPVRFGTGVSIKALEAIRSGRHVVSTSKGVRGIPQGNRPSVIVADNPQQFANCILKALE